MPPNVFCVRYAGDSEGDSTPLQSKWLLSDKACEAIAEKAEPMEEACRWLLEDALEGGELTDIVLLTAGGGCGGTSCG